MSLLVDQILMNSYNCEDFNKIKKDPVEVVSKDLILEIFSQLNLATLGATCSVSTQWEQLVSDPNLWKKAIYREIAFGNNKWRQCFGTDVVKGEDNEEELSSFPWKDFIEDCKKFKSIFPERGAKDSLMFVRLPKTLNGGLTLKSLGELAKKYFSASITGYRFISSDIVQELGDKSIDKSRWVLMTKDVIPESRNKSYGEQQEIVAELAKESLINYEVPEVLVSAVCIFSEYFGLNRRLFSNHPWTYTRCKENVQNYQAVIGGFTRSGLDINDDYVNIHIGVAALRKF